MWRQTPPFPSIVPQSHRHCNRLFLLPSSGCTPLSPGQIQSSALRHTFPALSSKQIAAEKARPSLFLICAQKGKSKERTCRTRVDYAPFLSRYAPFLSLSSCFEPQASCLRSTHLQKKKGTPTVSACQKLITLHSQPFCSRG